jgi:SagB-type dehydrogenase family enzyme
VLLARRSWRQFAAGQLTMAQLSDLLGLTWGVHGWMRFRPELRSGLKTSPSGGACHSLEVYVVAQHVEGLPAGVYHYCPDTHDLEVVRDALAERPIATLLGGQPWFEDCAALFLMTAVMPRVEWKYPFPRAYRTVLIEAGHFGQTCCLVATWLGLAPFCAAAMADSVIEETLRVDGITETVLYVTGVGTRPANTEWAPWPAPHGAPPLESPAHAGRPQS